MARRGEGQFVAAEIGLREDPKVLGLARRLGISRNEAVGVVVAWRSFVLLKGTFEGVVKGYTREEIAGYLEVSRSAGVIVDALKGAGMLVSRRGGAFSYPFWLETATGEYAQRKATERLRKAEWREKQRAGETSLSADRDGTGTGQGRDVPGTNRHEGRNEEPPGAPQGGGRGGANALSDWFLENYPKVRNPKRCRKLMGELDEGEAAQLRYALPQHVRIYEERKKGKGWRFVPFADSYLADRVFWEFQRPKPKLANGNGPSPEEKARLEAEEKAKYDHARLMLEKRSVIRERLKAEGVGRHELEQRIDDELGKELPS